MIVRIRTDKSDLLPPPFGDFLEGLPDQSVLNRFTETIYEHYGASRRSMPWRETTDPYEILVSEIMLQQTQVSRVLPKYHEFLTRWPTIRDLARASLRDVLGVWQGLGYNRRGRALYQSASIVNDRCNGVVPADVESLLSLPGIGPATAAAIRSFAYDIPSVYLETNVRRVYIYFFFDAQDRVRDSSIMQIADAALDRTDSRNWNYALMDYGVFLKECLPNPNKRSAVYAQQPAFAGSDRQIRGRVLAYLVKTESARLPDLVNALPFAYDRIESCTRSLANEGMIAERDGQYFVP